MRGDGGAEYTISSLGESELSTFDPRCAHGSEVHITGTFTAPETGRYYFALSSLGPATFSINDKVVLSQEQDCADDMGYLFGAIPGNQMSVSMEKGVDYLLNIHTEPHKPANGQGVNFLTGRSSVRVGCMHETEHDSDLLAEAVELSKGCDLAIVFTGHDTAWETEGQDRIDFHLPKQGSQDRLVAAVSAAASKTIVVNSTGSAVALPWLDQVQGLIQCWLPGQEAGHSIADVLTGTQNPEGHLPCTFPKRLEDCPAYGNFPGRYVDGKLKVEYAEGVFVGYRHFDRLPADRVHFPFGFGLSYTKFTLSDLAVLTMTDDNYTASVKLENSGSCAGAVAVQLYVGKEVPDADSPVKILAAFDKVRLKAGESVVAQLPIKVRDFARFDELRQEWVVDGGRYIVYVGRNAADTDVSTTIHVNRQTFQP
jgi:beta-glucosidase